MDDIENTPTVEALCVLAEEAREFGAEKRAQQLWSLADRLEEREGEVKRLREALWDISEKADTDGPHGPKTILKIGILASDALNNDTNQ